MTAVTLADPPRAAQSTIVQLSLNLWPRPEPEGSVSRAEGMGVDTVDKWTVSNLRGLGVDSGVDKRGRFVPRGAA